MKEWSQSSGGSKEGVGHSKIKKFVELIQRAMAECYVGDGPRARELFSPGLTLQLLLAFLWAKVTDKVQLLGYYRGLATGFCNTVTTSKLDVAQWPERRYEDNSSKLLGVALVAHRKWHSSAKHFQRAVAAGGMGVLKCPTFPLPTKVPQHSHCFF